jgi:pimeloyl-ACP methyl ester carboxylesterase
MGHTFVLVHGAWHGGWRWRRVAERLRALEHVVYTPTLTGLGERSHLIALTIGLTTHITDVVNVIAWEELDDIALCGHSYGGMVIAGVAERMSEKIRSIVFLDAFLPRNSDATIDLVPPAGQQSMRERLSAGETVLQPRSAEAFAVNEADRAWIDRLRAAACQGHGGKDRAHRRLRARCTQDLHPRARLSECRLRRLLRACARGSVVANGRGRLRARRDGGPARLARRAPPGRGGRSVRAAPHGPNFAPLRLVSARLSTASAMRC